VLASSINFKVELQLVAFVQLAQARTFNRADVHERIRLAIITGDEAEALHAVEELDRASGLFTGQLALRGSRLGRDGDDIAHNLKVGGRNLATAIDQVEFQRLAFGQAFETGAFHGTDVDEHVFAAVFTLNEAEALLAVEELDHTLAGANDLGGHAATAAAATARAAEAAAAIAAAKAAAITAAEATAVTTAEATAAIAAAKATAITAAKAAAIVAAAKTAATAVGIETAVVAETVALVASATTPPSIKTHKTQ
jgi:hypothetical protein